MRPTVHSLVLALVALAFATFAAADGRYALVIGNSDYSGTAPLANPANDARAIAEKLEELGFETTLLLDAKGAETIRGFSEFNRQTQGADIALFYFAGHGVQVGANSFLLPTDVSVESEETLRYTAIDAGWIVREMEKRAEVSLVILDACRDNPFPEMLRSTSRSVDVSRGLGIIQLSGKGAIIAYAAAAGRVAEDGDALHSPYTEALLEEIDAPGVEVGLMLRRVAGRVIDKTGGNQRPELLVRLIDEVYLNPAPTAGAPAAVAQETAPAPETGVPETVAAPEAPAAEPETEAAGEIVVAEAAVSNGRSTGEWRMFGDRPIKPPVWFEGLSVPAPSGWTPADPAAITDTTPGQGFSAAHPLPLAALVETRIAERGQKPWYRVDVPTAGELVVTVDKAPPELDLHARVHNADHNVVANWIGSNGAGAPLEAAFPLPGPGRYWLEVSDGRDDAASAETFALAVTFRPADDPLEPNPSIGRAHPVPADVSLKPTVFPRGDYDWLTFWVDRPGLLTADATHVPEALNVEMRVLDYDGNVIRNWAGPGRPGGDTVLDAELSAPGQYFLVVHDSRDDAASVTPFDLAVAFHPVDDDMEPNGSFGSASLQPPSSAHRVAIFPRGDHDWIGFDVDHPGMLDLSATSVPDNLDVNMRVHNADGTVIKNWFGPPRPGGDTLDYADLPKPGRYFVEIADGRDDASNRQSFDLTLTYLPQPDQYEPNDSFADARPLTPGGEILFNILPRGDHDRFRIDVPSAGELSVIIDPSPENLDLHYRVFDADRNVILNWVAPYRMGGVTEGFADLPAAGTYFLEIVDGRDDARAIEHAVLKTVFRATPDPLEPNNSFGAAQLLALGAPHQGFILPRGDVDWYLVEIDQPGALSVEISDVAENLDISFRVWTDDGVAGGWIVPPRTGAPVSADTPIRQPGLYRIEVSDGRADARSASPYTIVATLK